ncbi:sensor histidine kinase [Novosphingobium sp. M1R2S20]|uniref:histidine kinase n=1 Tax=Novosphingobium rhizovicinum TaxID=3228928 RepID=A0ABV3R8Z4_9SPHN
MRDSDMDERGPLLARARSDAEDHLLSADEPLAGLQRSCGGAVPGVIAVPELLELVTRARRSRSTLAKAINAQDGADTISAWVDVEPQPDGAGCEIVLRSWRTAPLPAEDAYAAFERRATIEREVAELVAWLDAEQRILAVESESAELQDIAAEMQGGIGQPFTQFLAPEKHGTQPLHWRMLDGAQVRVAASDREWRIVLLPQLQPGRDPAGFELLLVSDQPPPVEEPPALAGMVGGRALVGQDLAPVLRQPIARIVANAETIRTRLAGPLPDAYADYAGEIANAGRLLLGLLEDLSDLEVVESAGFSTAPDHIDLAEVARQAAGILGVRAREKNISIEGPGPSERLNAVAEFRRVLQVLINLIGNAIRYSPEHSRIRIQLAQLGERARVVVGDEGPGLSPQQQAIVFEKFERLGRSGDGGSGLGLYISRRLARAMGGELSVDSEEGSGARFFLDLPADPGSEAD